MSEAIDKLRIVIMFSVQPQSRYRRFEANFCLCATDDEILKSVTTGKQVHLSNTAVLPVLSVYRYTALYE